jgi:hypothetical protein
MAATHSNQQFGNAFLRPPQKSGSGLLKTPAGAKPPAKHPAERKLTFTKIFRWYLPDGQTHEPSTVEIVGTFTNWEKKPLIYDRAMRTWHLMLQNIQGNRTHHYMLLADGKPVEDGHSDGTAIPNGAQELQFAIATARGPRVFMLFSQTK